MDNNERKQKHLTLEDRVIIETGLNAGSSMRAIALQLGKDPSTISKEVRKRRTHLERNTFNDSFNQCALLKECHRKNVCASGALTCQRRECRRCSRCNSMCPDFVRRDYHCPKLDRAPFVCNACSKKSGCRLQKAYYRAAKANSDYRSELVESRRGLNISEEDLIRLDGIVSPLIRQGQTPYMILKAHPEINLCEKTIYNYIDDCLLDVRNIDLPRKVRFRVRRHKPEFKVDKACRIGRTYNDFEAFIGKNPDTAVVQMDSVIGSVGGKCLLTIHFVQSSFMLAFLRDANTSQSVIDIFNTLDIQLGPKVFSRLFPVILTDNGSEFSNPKKIEDREHTTDEYSIHRTHVFYCDAGSPHQKGAIEVNHELIRRVLPKGSSFDSLTQEDIIRMMNHINSYKRKKLNNRSPYETFSFHFGEEVLYILGYESVPADQILLKPALLKK